MSIYLPKSVLIQPRTSLGKSDCGSRHVPLEMATASAVQLPCKDYERGESLEAWIQSLFEQRERALRTEVLVRLETHHSFRGSFSAVSTPIFATKYSFCSILRDLLNELAEFSKFCKKENFFFLKIKENSAKLFCRSRKMLKN